MLLPVFIEEIIIADELFHDREISSLHLSYPFIQLRNIEIGDKCFNNVYEFVLDGLGKLESVKIGEKCFRMSNKERNDGVCRITNCPNLIQLEIGRGSFYDFAQFELSNVNSLQSIIFGYVCFFYAEDCILKGE